MNSNTDDVARRFFLNAYPDTPEWVTTGLALIAKIKGVDDTDG